MRSADIDTDYDYDDNYELEISTNNKNPSTSEYIRLTIDTDDDYYGKITLTAKYRSSTYPESIFKATFVCPLSVVPLIS